MTDEVDGQEDGEARSSSEETVLADHGYPVVGQPVAAMAAKVIAERNDMLKNLRKQAVQASSLSSMIAKTIAAREESLLNFGKHNAIGETLAATVTRNVTAHQRQLDDLRKQIATAQTTSLSSTIAKTIAARHTWISDIGKQMEAARGSVLDELATRASETSKLSSVAGAAAEASLRYGRWTSLAQTALEALGSQLGESGSTAWSVAASGAVTNLRKLDRYTPASARLTQFTATSRLAEYAVGAGALTSWRASLEADRRIALSRRAIPSAELERLARVAKHQVDLTSWAVRQDSGHTLLTDLSGRPVLEWRNRLAETMPAGEEPDPGSALVAGQATLGLVGGDLLTSVAPDDELAEEVTDRVEDQVLDPWEMARVDVFRDLYAVLRAIEPTVPELLQGAWDDVHRAGPAAAVKAANCVIEVVDRTFRAAAPDEEVRAWHQAEQRSEAEWEGRPRPPHALRAKYLARNLGDDRALVEAQADAFAAISRRIRGPIQKIKHASRGDIARVRTLLLSAEYLLVALFLEGDSRVDREH